MVLVNAGKKTQRLGDGLADLLALVRIAGAEDARVRRAVGMVIALLADDLLVRLYTSLRIRIAPESLFAVEVAVTCLTHADSVRDGASAPTSTVVAVQVRLAVFVSLAAGALLPPGGAKVRVLVAIEAALAPILLAIAVPPLRNE